MLWYFNLGKGHWSPTRLCQALDQLKFFKGGLFVTTQGQHVSCRGRGNEFKNALAGALHTHGNVDQFVFVSKGTRHFIAGDRAVADRS